MSEASTQELSVNISPGVSMLGVLSHLNYEPWFALAEYVDNAVQSALDNWDQLEAAHDGNFALEVSIEIDTQEPGKIVIRDNAAGIPRSEFPRAFRPAAVPPDQSGLSEFGMGMKSASCWFAREWSVLTTALGEPSAYQIEFDVSEIVEAEIEELSVDQSNADEKVHFTQIELRGLYRIPRTKTISKIKQHLTDIYRVLQREGKLSLKFNGEELVYEMPQIHEAPFYKDAESDAKPKRWLKEIDFDLSDGRTVSGFAALRETGSTSNAGFSLFRRNRVIEGSGDDGYRPALVFGAGNSYRSQRLFGELHLDGFEVSHTKDGFKWAESEEEFLEKLRSELDAAPLPLLAQAEGFRKLEATKQRQEVVEQAVESTGAVVEAQLPAGLPEITAGDEPSPDSLPTNQKVSIEKRVSFSLDGRDWEIVIQAADDTELGSWYSQNIRKLDPTSAHIDLRLNTGHPFVVRFGQYDLQSLEAILRFAVATCVAEVLATEAGVRQPSVVPGFISRILTTALSKAD